MLPSVMNKKLIGKLILTCILCIGLIYGVVVGIQLLLN